DVENAAVAGGPRELPDELVDLIVTQTDSQAGDTGLRGEAADLFAGHSEQALGIAVEVAVEHPILSRDKLLDEAVGAFAVFRTLKKVEQLGAGVDQELGSTGSPAQTSGVGGFCHHRKFRRVNELLDILPAPRND